MTIKVSLRLGWRSEKTERRITLLVHGKVAFPYCAVCAKYFAEMPIVDVLCEPLHNDLKYELGRVTRTRQLSYL